MLLGDVSSVNPDTLKDVAIIVLAVSTPLLVWWNGRRRRIEPQPLQIEKIEKLISREAFESRRAEVNHRLDAHDADIRAIYAELKADRERQERLMSERSSGIYRRIEDVRKELSDKIDSMPDRIIKTLSELNLLKRP